MVRVAEPKQDADPVTAKLFMTSVRSWENEKGIKLGVEKVSNLFANKQDKKKRGIAVTYSILGEMEKCRARVIEDGKVVRVEDEKTGDIRDEIEIISDPSEVTFFYNVRIEDEEKNEFSVNPKASCFPIFNFAFQATGDLPEDNDKGFIASIDELKAALQGIEFMAKVKEESFQGGNSYLVLVPSVVVDDE